MRRPLGWLKVSSVLWQLRKEIDTVDDEIIRLLAKRLSIAEAIGDVKRKLGIPPVDREREEEVIGRWVNGLVEAGFDEASARGIAELVVRAATKRQTRNLYSVRVTVVGSGRLGKVLKGVLSPVTPTTLISMRDELPNSDVVILTTRPTEETINYIRVHGDKLRGRVLMDAFSVKSRMFKVIEEESRELGFRYLSIHPLFGNVADTWGEAVILIPSVTSRDSLPMAMQLFEAAGLKPVIISDPEMHDKVMAYVQAAHHLTLLALYMMLRDAGKLGNVNIGAVATHSLRYTMRAIERVLEQIDVVEEIQEMNPYAGEARGELIKYINIVNSAVSRGELSKVIEG